MPFPLAARDFLSRVIFKQVDVGKYISVVCPINESSQDGVPRFTPSVLKDRERTRGELTTLAIFEPLPHYCCRFRYFVKVDIKGNIPKLVAEAGLNGAVIKVREAHQLFERAEEVSTEV